MSKIKTDEKTKNFMDDSVFKHYFKSDKFKYWFYEIVKDKTGIDLNKYHLTNNESY